MPLRKNNLSRMIALAACVLALAQVARACEIPVFRYALEMWPAAPYRAIVFHRGALAGAAGQAVDYLLKAQVSGAVNIEVHLVDLSTETDQELLALWRALEAPALPRLMLFYPNEPVARGAPPADSWTPAPGATCVWSSELSMKSARAIIDSPARDQIARNIIRGDAGVWVLIESGHADKDSAAAKTLAAELKASAKLATASRSPDSPFSDEAPVAFSIVRISRADEAEKMLLAMLLGTEADLASDFASDPIAFAVYGRARALPALVAKGIESDNIARACDFVTGPCSCVVKALNPGVDLLVRAAWDASIGESMIPDLPPPVLTGLPVPAVASPQAAPPTQPQPAELAKAPAPARASYMLRAIVLACALVVSAVLISIVLVRRKTRAD